MASITFEIVIDDLGNDDLNKQEAKLRGVIDDSTIQNVTITEVDRTEDEE